MKLKGIGEHMNKDPKLLTWADLDNVPVVVKCLGIHEASIATICGPNGLLHLAVVKMKWIRDAALKAACVAKNDHFILAQIVETSRNFLLKYQDTGSIASVVRCSGVKCGWLGLA